jgi:hypothetical protein
VSPTLSVGVHLVEKHIGEAVSMKYLNFGFLVVLILGCGDGAESTADAILPTMDGPTWHGEIKGIVEQNCQGCHVEGGGTPFNFDSYDAVRTLAPVSLNSMESGSMPPWMPNPDCRHYQDERIMNVGQIATFKEWIDNDMPEGVETSVDQSTNTLKSDVLAEFGPPTFIAQSAEPYLPDTSAPDDYRCFQVGDVFTEDTFVKATRIIPDATAIVHHVLLYVITPQDVAELEARDAEEDGPGYSCFGGPGIGQSFAPIAGWAPGGLPQITPEGVARYIPAGSKLVMQLHYNVLNGGVIPDQTSVEFYTTDDVPDYELKATPQAYLGLDIPAGDSESVQVTTFAVNKPDLTVIGVAPHMHSIGTHIRVDMIRADGTEECLVDIPKWDFNWQQTYRFLEDEVIVAQPGDAFRLTCVYDNSETNQPVVNGEQLVPRRVTWGDGTLDEMCLNYIHTIEPFEPVGARCAGLSACRDECEDPNDFDCILNCGAADQACGQCVVLDMVQPGGCARDECGTQLRDVGGCFQTCAAQLVAGGNIAQCLSDSCPEEYEAFSACMTPAIAGGLCDEGIDSCTD